MTPRNGAARAGTEFGIRQVSDIAFHHKSVIKLNLGNEGT